MLASESRVRGQAVEASGGSHSLVDLEQKGSWTKGPRGRTCRQTAANVPDFVLNAFMTTGL